MAPLDLSGRLPAKEAAKTANSVSINQSRRRSTAPAKSSRPNRREADEAQSQEAAERKAQARAAKEAAKVEALEREWRVQQVAGELGRQADLLERHRYLVAKYGAADAPDQGLDTELQTSQVSPGCFYFWLVKHFAHG